eukprot:1161739-Pelagomonas_calceolata.AAC.3
MLVVDVLEIVYPQDLLRVVDDADLLRVVDDAVGAGGIFLCADLLHEVDDAVGGENIRPPSNISLSTASKASSQQLHPRHSALAEQSIPQEHAGRTTTATGTHAPGSSVLGGSSKGLSIAAGGGASGMAGGGDGNGGPGSAAERPNSGGSGGGGRQRGKLQV